MGRFMSAGKVSPDIGKAVNAGVIAEAAVWAGLALEWLREE